MAWSPDGTQRCRDDARLRLVREGIPTVRQRQDCESTRSMESAARAARGTYDQAEFRAQRRKVYRRLRQ